MVSVEVLNIPPGGRSGGVIYRERRDINRVLVYLTPLVVSAYDSQ